METFIHYSWNAMWHFLEKLSVHKPYYPAIWFQDTFQETHIQYGLQKCIKYGYKVNVHKQENKLKITVYSNMAY